MCGSGWQLDFMKEQRVPVVFCGGRAKLSIGKRQKLNAEY